MKNMQCPKDSNDSQRSAILVGVVVALMITVVSILIAAQASAAPAGPALTYISNSTVPMTNSNRSVDAKGTITVMNMVLNQQDYKWKAYVGNITGGLALEDVNRKAIYDWSLSTITGEIYATRSSSTINWGSVACVNQSVIDTEQSLLGMSSAMPDSINATFNATTHKSFLIGTSNITASSCRSIATYINDAPQTLSENAFFQEILLRDVTSSALIYTTIINNDHASYDGVSTYDFQLIVAENESSTTPTTYFFYAELG